MATIYFTTDQSGANTEVCTTASSAFNFSAASDHTAAYASLVVKRGSGTTAGLTVAIYNGANASGSVVATVTVPAASISQTYGAVQFDFPANTVLAANQTYSLKVSSTTSCGGSNAYFFKAGNFQIYNNATAALLSVGYGIGSTVVAAPAASAHATLVARPTALAAGRTQTTATITRSVAFAANAAAEAQTVAVVTLTNQVAASFVAGAAVAATVYVDVVAAAGCTVVVNSQAAASTLRSGETNRVYHGTSLISWGYVGEARVKRIYLGTTLMLDQPT